MSSPKMQSVLLGALVYVVLSVILQFAFAGGSMSPAVGMLGCVIAIVAPVVAVWHYTNTNLLTIPAGSGAGLGALASATGAVISGLLTFLLQALQLLPSTEEMIASQREQMLSQGMDAEQIDQAMGMAEMFANPLVGMLMGIVIGAVIGAIAGAIAALIFKKGEEDELAI